MDRQSRREFLAEVGRGVLVASVGYGTAVELGLSTAQAEESPERLRFGDLEPLVSLLQETPPAKILPVLVERLRGGTELRALLAAGALANARVFGGEDYVGFHTLMALAPSYHMALELPEAERPLPVLKVLYRNSRRIEERAGPETLHPVLPGPLAEGRTGAEALQQAVRAVDMAGAEATFAALARGSAEDAFNDLLQTVEDTTEVHRVVLPYRAWDLLGLIGKTEAHTLLRQSVRYCVKSEKGAANSNHSGGRKVLPRLLEQHHLLSRAAGQRLLDDAALEGLSMTIFRSSPEEAAAAVAAALAEGIAPESVGEALSLAANQLLLRDQGRTAREVQPNKPAGSVHGDSIGVHACDSANAWRNMARVSNPRNQAACLILGAYQAAFDRINRGGDFLSWEPHPLAPELEAITEKEAPALLKALEAAIRESRQASAAALVGRYGALGHAPRAVFDLLLRHAVSEDGALHGEKYYRTASEEFAASRPAFRWRHLVTLARVTASEYGRPAPGIEESRQLLKLA